MEKEESITGIADCFDNMRARPSVMNVRNETKSIIKSGGVVNESAPSLHTPSPLNFDVYMPWACKLYHIDVVVKSTNTQSMHDHSSKIKKRRKSDAAFLGVEGVIAAATQPIAKDKSSKTSSTAFMGKDFYTSYTAIQILATHDSQYKLSKINLHNNREVPRTLFKVISLIVKFYPALTTLTVNSGINMYSIYEISKLLPQSALKEIYLDGTRLKNPNYHLLLEKASRLTCLSLAKCQINDEALKHITDLLAFPLPASKTLTVLNLSSNSISDKGAQYLAEALRTNRQIAWLNLADNKINDTGAFYIFDVLLQFPIAKEKMIQSKFRCLKYNNRKMALIAQYAAELKTAEEMRSVRKRTIAIGTTSFKRHSLETRESIPEIKKTIYNPDPKYADKAHSLAMKKLGEIKDPFLSPASFTKNGEPFCIGNTALASLNISYNNLSYLTLKKLLKVLNYQKDIMQKPRGLFRVRIEGNYIPKTCEEYAKINELLSSSLDYHQCVVKNKKVVR